MRKIIGVSTCLVPIMKPTLSPKEVQLLWVTRTIVVDDQGMAWELDLSVGEPRWKALPELPEERG